MREVAHDGRWRERLWRHPQRHDGHHYARVAVHGRVQARPVSAVVNGSTATTRYLTITGSISDGDLWAVRLDGQYYTHPVSGVEQPAGVAAISPASSTPSPATAPWPRAAGSCSPNWPEAPSP